MNSNWVLCFFCYDFSLLNKGLSKSLSIFVFLASSFAICLYVFALPSSFECSRLAEAVLWVPRVVLWEIIGRA